MRCLTRHRLTLARLLLLGSGLALSLPSLGCSESELVSRMAFLSDVISRYLEICRDEKTGKVDLNRNVIDAEGVTLDCQREYQRIQILRSDIETLRSGRGECSSVGVSCRYESSHQSGLPPLRPSQMACVEQVAQELYPQLFFWKSSSELPGSCFSEFIYGTIKDVVYNAEGLAALAKGIGMSLTGPKKSNAAPPKQPHEDPSKMVPRVVAQIWAAFDEAIKNDFGCRKWSGMAHASQCLEPLTDWDQADCAQTIQVYCGISGYAGGELASAFLMGGAAGLTTRLASVSAKMSRVASLTKYMAKVSAPTAKVVARASERVRRASESVWANMKNSPQFREWESLSKKVSETSAARHTMRLTAIGLSPIKSYLHLLDESFVCGYRQGRRLPIPGATSVEEELSNLSH